MEEYSPLHEINTPYEIATFGMGCYWAAESLFGATKGVLRTKVGYTGDKSSSQDVTEIVEIHFDPKLISYNQLLQIFWDNHNSSTELPVKYMSLILYHNNKQYEIAKSSLKQKQEIDKNTKIFTIISKAGKFYPDKDNQQKYHLQKHEKLMETLNLNSGLLQTSYIACKLNGYLCGAGKIEDFLSDVKDLGLTSFQKDYVIENIKNNRSGDSCQ